QLAPLSPGGVMYFGLEADGEVIVRHRAEGGRVVFTRDGDVYIAEGPSEERLSRVADIPLVNGGLHLFHLQNVLAAIAAAWALAIPLDTIRAGIEAFAS